LSNVRAAVLEAFGRPLALRELPRPALGAGEALVRIAASGVCGSDVHMAGGADPRVRLPLVLGHESVGVIEETAGQVRSRDGRELRPGDAVAWDRGVYCGSCAHCAAGREHLCPSRRTYGIHYGGSTPPQLAGGYATHIVLGEGTRIFRLPEGARPAELVSCACSGATAAHSVEAAAVAAGELAVVLGAGPLGLWTIALLAEAGARVVAIGRRERRLELAREFGAAHVFDEAATSAAERREAMLEISGGLGADVVIDTTSSLEAAREGLAIARRGGRYVNSGAAVPVGEMPLRLYEDLVQRDISLRGVWVSGSAHFAKALAFALARAAALGKMVTHRFPLERANEALEAAARDRSAVKVVLEP